MKVVCARSKKADQWKAEIEGRKAAAYVETLTAAEA